MFILLYFSPVVLVSWPLAHSGQSVRLLLGSAPIFLLVSRLALIFQQLLLRQSVFIAAWFHSLRGTTTLHLRLCIFSYSSSFVLPSAVLISWSFALSGQSVRLLLGSRVTLFPLISRRRDRKISQAIRPRSMRRIGYVAEKPTPFITSGWHFLNHLPSNQNNLQSVFGRE